MNTIKIDYDIARPPDEVFAFLTDFSQLTRWRTLDSIRLEPNAPAQVGSRLFSTVTAMNRRMEFTNEIVDLNQQRRFFRDRFLAGSFPIQSSWQVEPHNGGSQIKWITEFEGQGLMKLLTPILSRTIRQGQLDDLAKLKQLLERK
jgi:uncharacterized protein YndB with AHSA1/START domain